MFQKFSKNLFNFLLLSFFFPFFCSASINFQTRAIEEVSIDELLNKTLEECPRSCLDPKFKLELIQAFETLFINLHDFILNEYYNPIRFSFPLLNLDDPNKITSILKSCDAVGVAVFRILLVEYVEIIQLYGFNTTTSRCNLPNALEDLNGVVFNNGDILANFLIKYRKNINCEEKKFIHILFSNFSQSWIDLINNTMPSCSNFESPINALASGRAYTKMRILAGLIAIEVAKTFSSMKSCGINCDKEKCACLKNDF